jgi:predicted amidohydrolase YtcJ
VTTSYLFHGGPILTMADGAARPEALLSHGDRISFVGGLDEARDRARQAGLAPDEVDLGGGALLPGFIDAHLHPLPMMFFAANADLEDAASLAEVRERLEALAPRLTDGEWLIGVQFESKRLAAAERLDRAVLDAWFPERPTLIYTRDGHAVIVNSATLRAAGIGEDAAAPEGGSLGRDADGRLDGVFYEAATGLPLARMPGPDPMRMLEASRTCFAALAAEGITSIGAMMQSDEEGPGGASARMESQIVQAFRAQMPQSIYTIVIGKTLDGIRALAESPLNELANRTRARAIKIFADGTFGSCTACMSEPYADRACTHGYMTLSDDEIYCRMEAAHLAGYQICIHAIGDQGIANCVRLFERLLAEHPRNDHRHRIEHASIADPDLIARIARLGLQVCTQPLFIRSEKDWLPARLGAERTPHVYPFRDFFAAGIPLAGSSDAPIERPDVIAAIDFAVNRGGFHPEQGVTPEQAVAMFTRNAAFVQFEEAEKGALEAGKVADMVILSASPLNVPAERLGEIKVLRTMIAGAFVHTTGTAAAGQAGNP